MISAAEEAKALSKKTSVLKTRKGNFTLRVTCDDGTEKTLHSLYDPESEALSLVDAFQYDGRGILVVLGLGLGYHVVQLKEKYPEANIVVIEAHEEIVELARQYGPQLSKEITLISGKTGPEAISRITEMQTRGGGLSSLSVFSLNAEVSAFSSHYRPIRSSLEKIVSLRLWDRLKYAKFKDERKKVLIIDSGYFVLKEVEVALDMLGHETQKTCVNGSDNSEMIIGALMEDILRFRPDFILTMNHLGLDRDGLMTSFFNSIEMPVASWYVDSPNLIVKASGGNVSSLVSIFLWDRTYLEDMKEMGFEFVDYLPLGTDGKVFRPFGARKHRKKTAQYSTDVGFVGNSMVEPVKDWMDKVAVTLHPLVERIAGEIAESGDAGVSVLSALAEEDRQSLNGLEESEKMDLEAAVLWIATLLYRKSCVENLGAFRTAIHGDSGWRELLKTGDFSIRKPLHYYRELPFFYNACNINFNATSRQMPEAVNQRVFDVPACGSFLLTDYQSSLEDLFRLEKEIVVYHHREEIGDLVRFYLKNPEKRRAIAEEGRKRVLEEHTYTHRITSLITCMEQRYRS